MDGYLELVVVYGYIQPISNVGHRANGDSNDMNNARLGTLSSKNMKLYVY